MRVCLDPLPLEVSQCLSHNLLHLFASPNRNGKLHAPSNFVAFSSGPNNEQLCARILWDFASGSQDATNGKVPL